MRAMGSALRRTSSIALAALAAICACAPATAGAATQSAQAGNVSATFTFQGTFASYSGLRLQITRAGAVVYDQPVTSTFCGQYCGPGKPPGVKGSSVHVLDLAHDGNLDVVLDLYSGGAHCCTIEEVFSYDATTNTYSEVEHNFGNYGDVLKDISHDGRTEFIGADDAFAYLYTSFAGSGLPIRIFSFTGGKFVPVTRSYPALIRKDAANWLRYYKRNIPNGEGLIAAWAADEFNLGKVALVKRTLATEVRRRHLPRSFPRRLVRDLRKFGY
jgi:hypothetical protein